MSKSLFNRRTPEEQKQLNRDSRHRKSNPIARNRGRVEADRWDEETRFERIRPSVRRGPASRPDRSPPAIEPQRVGAADPDTEPRASWHEGTIVGVHRGLCDVCVRGEVVVAAIDSSSQPAVGDRAHVELTGGPEGVARLRSLSPRRTVLSRPDPHDPRIERVLAANVDVAVVVVSVRTPPLHPRLIDRFLIAIERGGIVPVVCVNKIDLVTEEGERQAIAEVLAPYERLGVRVVLGSAETGLGMDALRAAIVGKTAVFVGHSGVGKSSVLNAIDPAGERRTGGLRVTDGRGRHTTTSSRLIALADGTQVIDTPGIRALGLWKMDRDHLRFFFSDIAAFAEGCRFRDCSHLEEPGCAVRVAVEEGTIARARWETFLRMIDTLE